MCYSGKMDYDKEVDEILEFISRELNRIKTSEFGELLRIARAAGLSPKNMSDFSNKYGPGSNPQFRTVYKILSVLLKRKPIVLHENMADIKAKMIALLDKI